MAELKTQPNDQRVEDFLNSVADGTKRQDSFTILPLLAAGLHVLLTKEQTRGRANKIFLTYVLRVSIGEFAILRQVMGTWEKS